MLFLELAGVPVPDVVADIFLVDQNLMDGAARPGPVQVGQHALSVQVQRNLDLIALFLDEAPIDRPHDLDLFGRPRHQDNAVRLKALMVIAVEQCLGISLAVNEHPPQTEPSRATLPEAHAD
ncbi:hypothetical protein D9M68_966710 [compost metagenome]